MYRELEEAGCPAPEFKQQDFMVLATIRQHGSEVELNVENGTLNGTLNGFPIDSLAGKSKIRRSQWS